VGVAADAASTIYLTISDMGVAYHQQSFYTIGPSGAVGRFTVSSTAAVNDIAWSNGYLYFSSGLDSAVYRANAAGGVSVVAKGLVNPYGLVVITKYSFQ